MDRKHACLARAAACRERAEADAQDRDYWMEEAIRWLDVAQGPTGPVAVTFEAGDARSSGFTAQLNQASSRSRTRSVQQIQRPPSQ